MTAKNDVKCEYLADKSCNAVGKGEGGIARDESCSNELKSLCCYLCDRRESCEISCDFLDDSKKQNPQELGNEKKGRTFAFSFSVQSWM